jgi:hypothetical protein
MKSFHVLALREIKHIQSNYATYWQRISKCETPTGCISQLPLETETKFGKLQSQV